MGEANGIVDTRDMVVVHTAIRREYRLAPGLVRETAAGNTARASVIGGHLELLNRLLHHHHAGEDRLLWPKLIERVPTELAPIVTLMETQHKQIHEVMEEEAGILPKWAATASGSARDDLADALDRLYKVILTHLDAEEQHLLPIAARHLTPAEWARLGDEGRAGLTRKEQPLAFGMLMYGGDPEVISDMLSHAPAPVRFMLRRTAPRTFAKYAARVYGTKTP